MRAHHLRAPKDDGAILADPPLDQALAALGADVGRFASWDYDFQGRRFSALRAKAREDAIEVACRYHESAGIDLPDLTATGGPWVVTGHQPELFHPGVWVKNFAVAGLATASGGLGLNLIVDNDIPKGAFLRVPTKAASGPLRTQLLAFDDWAGEAPFEDQAIRDEPFFAAFPDRASRVLGGQVARPLIDRFWGHVRSAPAEMAGRDRVGRRFARARRLVEAGWGARNLEVPLGDLCETDGFRWFACHLLAQLPKYRAVHNDALGRYRALYGIRSRNHPVAALGRQGDWLEAPFWCWRASAPRRRPLLVRQLSRTIELRIGGEDAPFLQLPLAPDREACCAVETLRDLSARGIRLRTRALTTTMFARFLVGDLFLHGIGGAKYDELGDEIARGFFGVEPPAFLTLSMTLHLGLPSSTATRGELHSVERRLRDLTWQPERYLDGLAEVREMVEAKRRMFAEGPVSKADRRSRYEVFRRINATLAARVADERPQLEDARRRLAASLQEDSVARSREFSLVLFDEGRIGGAMRGVLAGAEGGRAGLEKNPRNDAQPAASGPPSL